MTVKDDNKEFWESKLSRWEGMIRLILEHTLSVGAIFQSLGDFVIRAEETFRAYHLLGVNRIAAFMFA